MTNRKEMPTDSVDARRVRATGARAGLAGRGGAGARRAACPSRAPGAPSTPRTPLLYPLRSEPGTIRLGTRTERDIQQVCLFHILWIRLEYSLWFLF